MMKFLRKTFIVLAVLAIPAIALAEDSDDSLDSLTAPARKTAESIVKNHKVTEVEPAYEDGIHASEIEYEQNGIEMAIVVTKDGKLLSKEARISVFQAPKVIQRAVAKQYPGSKMTHITKVTKKGVTFYRIAIRNGQDKVVNLKLDPKGKPIKAKD